MKNLCIFLCATFFLFSCGKDDPLPVRKDARKTSHESSVVLSTDQEQDITHTVLGKKRKNPFSVEAMKNAFQALGRKERPQDILRTGSDIATEIVATHLYVKFDLETLEDLAALEEWEEEHAIAVFDFPLEYDIEQQGDFYIPPSLTDTIDMILRDRYASVPIGTSLPETETVVITELFLNRADPLLLAVSLELTDNGDQVNPVAFHGGLPNNDFLSLYGNAGEVDAGPYGLIKPGGDLDCPLGCIKILIRKENELLWRCDCPDEGGDPPPPPTNACGCPIPDNYRYPAGCVQVDRTTSKQDGVQRAKIKTKGTWFRSDVTYTDDRGCWVVKNEYYNWMKYWVKFKNDNVRVKDLQYFLSIPRIIDYITKDNNPEFNLQQVRYLEAKGNKRGRMLWAAALALNIVNEYRKSAIIDNVPLPRNKLNWTNRRGDGASAAPMLQGHAFAHWSTYIITILSLPVLSFPVLNALPDIYLRYGENDFAYQLIATGCHELGHASHHAVVGEPYWRKYRKHITKNNGYGSYGNFKKKSNEGHVALGEAIGNYTGHRYGGAYSGGEYNEWDYRDNYIPQGLLYDLEDVQRDYVTDPNNSSISGQDVIEGFMPHMFFDVLGEDVNSIRAFRDHLRNRHLSNTPNNANDFNHFVDIYDVFH